MGKLSIVVLFFSSSVNRLSGGFEHQMALFRQPSKSGFVLFQLKVTISTSSAIEICWIWHALLLQKTCFSEWWLLEKWPQQTNRPSATYAYQCRHMRLCCERWTSPWFMTGVTTVDGHSLDFGDDDICFFFCPASKWWYDDASIIAQVLLYR
jgi:hypothetical protein